MQTDTPLYTAYIGKRPIHPMFVSFSISCLVGTLATDLAYSQTTNIIWETFSVWLLTAGLIVGGIAVLAIVIDLLRRAWLPGSSWLYLLGYIVALLLSLVNVFVHSRDGYTAVVPEGLALSAAVVVILAITGWISRRRNFVYYQPHTVVN